MSSEYYDDDEFDTLREYKQEDDIFPEEPNEPEEEIKGNKQYNDALKHQFAIHHVLNDGVNIVGRKFYGFGNITELLFYLNKTQRPIELHEILCNAGERPQRLFFDIDAPQDLIDGSGLLFSKVMQLIIMSIWSMLWRYRIKYDTVPMIQLCGNRPGKYSARIYLNLFVVGAHAGCIPKNVKANLEIVLRDMKIDPPIAKLLAGIIDTEVYNFNHQSRMHLSSKMTKNGLVPPLVIISEDKDYDDIDCVQRLINTPANASVNPNTIILHFDKTCRLLKCDEEIPKRNQCSLVAKEQKAARLKASATANAGKLIEDFIRLHPNYSVRTTKNGIINLLDNHTANCIICGRKHENEHPFLFIIPSGLYFRCRRAAKSILVAKITTQSTKTKLNIKEAVGMVIQEYDSSMMAFANGAAMNAKPDEEFQYVRKRTNDRFVTGFYDFMKYNPDMANKSQMGSGKSYEMEELVKRIDEERRKAGQKPATMVSIVHRVSMRESMKERYKRMGFELYNEIGGEIYLMRHKRILIQVESLYRLDASHGIDLLILDEYNAITQQFLSRLGPDHIKSLVNWEYICKEAKSTLMLDARLSPITIQAMEIITERSVSIWINDAPMVANPIVYVCENEATWEDNLLKKLQAGEKIDVVTTRGEHFCEQLKATIESNTHAKVLTIHGKKDNTDAVDSPNEKWVQFDCIIRSQTVNAGVDFNVPHFNCVFADIGSYGANSDDIMQSMRRSRNLLDNSYYLLFKKCGKFDRPVTEEGVKQYELNKIRHNIDTGIRDLGVKRTNDGWIFKDDTNSLFRAYLLYLAYHNHKTNDLFRDIIWAFREMGAKFEFLTLNATEASKVNDRIRLSYEKIRSKSDASIANARELEQFEYEQISKYKKNAKTPDDLAAIDKYRLRAIYCYQGPMNEEWVKKYKRTENMQMSRNIYLRYLSVDDVVKFNQTNLENAKTNIETLNIRFTGALRKSLEDVIKIHNEYNKTEFYFSKLLEYVNNQVEAKNPVFGSIDGKIENSTWIVNSINTVLLHQLGYKLIKKERVELTKNKTRIYNFEVDDISVDLFTPLDSIYLNDFRPMLRDHVIH